MMRSGTIAFLLGVCCLLWLPALPARPWLLLLVVIPALLLFIPDSRLLRLGAVSCAGAAWGLWHAYAAWDALLPPALEGEELRLLGRIDSLPQTDQFRSRFDFLVETIEGEPTSRAAPPGRVRLAWYGDAPLLRVGERWRLIVKLQRPHGMANPGGFEYERWLMQLGVHAVGQVRAKGENRQLAPAAGYPVQRLRESLRESILRALPEHPLAGVVVALAIGEQSGVSQEQWDLFARTGITHLISISGLHVGVVAWVAWALSGALWRRSPRLASRLPAPKAAALGGCLAAGGYALLAGFSIPTQRTLMMIAVAMAALWSQRQVEPSRVLCLALLAILIHDPFAVLASGFWLSFGAVGAIFYGASGRVGPLSRWLGWGRTQWVVTLGMLPLTIVLFARTPLIAPLANLLAIPWLELLVVPLTLIGTALTAALPMLGQPLLQGAALALEVAWWFLSWLAGLPLGWLVLAPPGWALAAGAAGLLWLLAPGGWPSRWLGAIWLLPMLFISPAAPRPGELQLTLLEVGQGLAAVVRTAGHLLVFDTGPAARSLDAGRSILAPFLRSQGVGAIDRLILSHGDNDHSGGARSLAADLPVRSLLSGPDAGHPGVPGEPCRRGQHWEWDGVHFEILNPFPGASSNMAENERSCVLLVTGEGGSVLLPADIGTETERRLVEHGLPAVTAVVVPHHGSRTSSSATLIEATRPAFVLFPVGHRNRWRFPNREVVERWRRSGAVLLRTDEAGAIGLSLRPGEPPELTLHRRDEPRWWRTLPAGE